MTGDLQRAKIMNWEEIQQTALQINRRYAQAEDHNVNGLHWICERYELLSYHPTLTSLVSFGAHPWKSKVTSFPPIPGVAVPYFVKSLRSLLDSIHGAARHRMLISHRFFIGFGRVYRGRQKPSFFFSPNSVAAVEVLAVFKAPWGATQAAPQLFSAPQSRIRYLILEVSRQNGHSISDPR